MLAGPFPHIAQEVLYALKRDINGDKYVRDKLLTLETSECNKPRGATGIYRGTSGTVPKTGKETSLDAGRIHGEQTRLDAKTMTQP
ncbi:protein of unknown function [Candidatus Nitrospira inopinata]|uniref:Uncharacterized protein n=1 Tax=Candidatus Nitrospira inopinata TaxID=1715989 RepID=A0A0S4KSZ1_9BACT|nr:protein of unknown function [Candidatus Nitrospira inopinata]